MARKFDNIGTRVSDVQKGFSFVTKQDPKVLEIGCGNGREAREILRHTCDYTGIDISEAMIALAKENAPTGRFEVADVENFEFPKNLDIIFSFASLLHSPQEQTRQILRACYKSLNESGISLISLKYGEYREETREDEFGLRTYYFYTPQLIKKLAGNKYKVVWEDIQELRGQKWFTIILQK